MDVYRSQASVATPETTFDILHRIASVCNNAYIETIRDDGSVSADFSLGSPISVSDEL